MAINPLSKRTTAQVVFIHTAESAALSALLTVLVGAVQYLSAHGLDLSGLFAVLGTSFLAQMAMVYKSLVANPNTAQAIADTEQQVQAALPPIVHVDVTKLAGELAGQLPLAQLATLLKAELMKPAPPVAPARPQPPVQDLPTRSSIPVPAVNLAAGGTALQQLGQLAQPPQGGSVIASPNADWMNQQPGPNRAG